MIKKNIKIFKIIIMLLVVFICYYLFLPPINITSIHFYGFFIFMYLIYLALSMGEFFILSLDRKGLIDLKLSKGNIALVSVIPCIIVGIVLVNFVLSPIFNSGKYANRISINEGVNFNEKVSEVDLSHVPLLDRDSTSKIGDRVMGEMTDLVSQFYVSNLYTQINYNDSIVRVTPLEYADMIKYFTNRKSGVPGYIVVDSVSGKASLVRLDKGMKYMPSAMFNENLKRKLRFSYPTLIFGDESFELDNDGNPFWVVPTIKYHGIGIRKEITGVVILDPVTGESHKYDIQDVPSWVDHVYSADLIMEEVNDWGLYNGGFFNSIFGQKNVVATTTGYNYMVQDDDVFLYTGITSVATDESNLGFILTNMRTKETNYYLIPGAEEYSAMASAEGQVQQMKYNATFPLLINLNGRATYLISLKDNAGLVKMYAFVDVQDYQKVSVTDASLGIMKARENYLKILGNENIAATNEKSITISSINSVLIDGNSYYYIIDSEGLRYRVSIKVNEDIIPFLKVGDKITITCNDSMVSEIVSIK